MRRCPSRSLVNLGSARSLVRRRARAAARLISARSDLPDRALLQPVRVEPLVGPGQQRRAGQRADLGPVPGHALQHGRLALRLAGAVLPARDPDARHQPAQVPLPAAGVRLVEVVQVDDQIPLRRGVEAEVPKVRVTADHRGDAGGRQPGHVRRPSRPPRRAGTRTAWRPSGPTRTGISQSSRPWWDSMISCTGSGRPARADQSPSELRGTWRPELLAHPVPVQRARSTVVAVR